MGTPDRSVSGLFAPRGEQRLDSRHRIALGKLRRRHDWYAISEAPDGTVMLTPVEHVQPGRQHE